MQHNGIGNQKSTTTGLVQLVLPILGWAVTLSVSLMNEWETLPLLAKYTVVGFVSLSYLVSLVLGLVPATKRVGQFLRDVAIKKRQRQVLSRFAKLLQEVGLLLELHRTSSLRCHIDSICQGSMQNREIASHMRGLSERMGILANWHLSLLAFSQTELRSDPTFNRRVRDITYFYRDMADIVRDFTCTQLGDEVSAQSQSDSGLMAKNKYNQHIDRVE